MQYKEIQVGFTYTKNLGNYESLKVDVSVTIAVAEGETVEDVSTKAWNAAKAQIKKGLDTFGAEGTSR